MRNGESLLTLEQFEQVKILFSHYAKRFVSEIPEVGGLKVKPYDVYKCFHNGVDQKPIRRRPYLTNPKLTQDMENRLAELVRAKVMIPAESNSTWGLPCFAVYSTGRPEPRVILDCREVNKLTKLDTGKVPLTRASIRKIEKNRFLILC